MPRDLRLLVAVRTTVNWTSDHDQMASVRRTNTFSEATFSSLKESKNSMMSAAVPGGRETLRDMYIYIYEYAYTIETKDLIIID